MQSLRGFPVSSMLLCVCVCVRGRGEIQVYMSLHACVHTRGEGSWASSIILYLTCLCVWFFSSQSLSVNLKLTVQIGWLANELQGSPVSAPQPSIEIKDLCLYAFQSGCWVTKLSSVYLHGKYCTDSYLPSLL